MSMPIQATAPVEPGIVPVAPDGGDSNTPDDMSRIITPLIEQGYPAGLAEELCGSKSRHPIRFWIVDNSGSMQIPDGHRLSGKQTSVKIAPCSRWKELQDAVKYHSELAGLLEAPTVFRLLNDPGRANGPQVFSIAQHSSYVKMDVEEAKAIIERCAPTGSTPLTAHVYAIYSQVKDMEQNLKDQGQKAVVIIATDGLPNDRDAFIQALRQLQILPVWIVIRLCTDDDGVVDFYNDLDQQLEAPLEVLDDFFGEGAEIEKVNPWLNYGLPLHRVREMGHSHRALDTLDERLLSKDELVAFLKLLFGNDLIGAAPDVHADWRSFSSFLSKLVAKQGKQWNPVTKKSEPWINMKKLNKAFGDRRGFGLFRR